MSLKLLFLITLLDLVEDFIGIDVENKQRKTAAFQIRGNWARDSNSGLSIMWNHNSEVIVTVFWEASCFFEKMISIASS